MTGWKDSHFSPQPRTVMKREWVDERGSHDVRFDAQVFEPALTINYYQPKGWEPTRIVIKKQRTNYTPPKKKRK